MRAFLVPVGFLALGVLLFTVLRDVPQGTCEEPTPQAVLDDYRSGLRLLANVAAVVTGVLIWRLRPGRITGIALACAAAAAIALNLPPGSATAVSYVVALLAAVPALVVMGLLFWLSRRAERRTTALRLAAAYHWLFLIIVIPAGVAVVVLAGDPVCLS